MSDVQSRSSWSCDHCLAACVRPRFVSPSRAHPRASPRHRRKGEIPVTPARPSARAIRGSKGGQLGQRWVTSVQEHHVLDESAILESKQQELGSQIGASARQRASAKQEPGNLWPWQHLDVVDWLECRVVAAGHEIRNGIGQLEIPVGIKPCRANGRASGKTSMMRAMSDQSPRADHMTSSNDTSRRTLRRLNNCGHLAHYPR